MNTFDRLFKEQGETFKRIVGFKRIELIGNELTTFAKYEVFKNGDGMYTVFVTERIGGSWRKESKAFRADKDEIYNFVIDKIELLGYTIGEME